MNNWNSSGASKWTYLVLCDAVDGSAVGVRKHRGNDASVHVQYLNGPI